MKTASAKQPIAVEESLRVNGPAASVEQPVRFGAPFPKGALREAASGDVEWLAGARSPAQLRPLSRWSDGSIKWLAVDAMAVANAVAGRPRLSVYDLAPNADRTPLDLGNVRCGPQTLAFAASRPPLGEHHQLWFVAENWSLTDRRGRQRLARIASTSVVEPGAVCSRVTQRASFAGLRGVTLRLEWTVYHSAGLVRCDATLTNTRRARHPGGLWDLGDRGSMLFQDFSFKLPAPGGRGASSPTPVIGVAEPSMAGRPSQRFSLYQDSSGGANWQSSNHVNRHGEVPCGFRGYRMAVDDAVSSDLRAAPRVTLRGDHSQVTLAPQHFWQNFPKTIEATPDGIRLGLFPHEWDDCHELQGGERKRHTFWLAFTDLDEDPPGLAWVDQPLVVSPDAAACVAAGVAADVQAKPSNAFNDFQKVLAEGITGERGLLANRELVDEYGWRNFGDTHADHERLHYHGDAPFVSHYNNQFDVLLGLLRQHLRTGDPEWASLADELARHVMDIDIYHTQRDRAAYNGGLFWFTDHYLTAHTSTHRTYSRRNAPKNGPYGGGPGAEHNFAEGLLLYHHLTGCPQARAAVIGLAEWVVRMEDGRRSLLGVIDDGATGLATAGKGKPARGGANSISVLLDAWSLTRRDDFLASIEVILRRCIHPDDDPNELDLLNAESNWSYTMFLTSLAKYLAAMDEAGRPGSCYGLARESLLRFAEWMLMNERPYLEHREQLDFPTEAWAAQEFRKANVLRRAAAYAGDALATQLRIRADELGDCAWRDLMQFDETRMTIRALALVMTEGLDDCVFRHHQPKPAEPLAVEPPTTSYPPRPHFKGQKQRLREALASPRGVARSAAGLLNAQRWLRWARRRSPRQRAVGGEP